MKIHDLPTPALLLDLDVLEANLRRMARRAEELGVRLRPHVKTHKCVEVGRMQREAGAEGITVATLEEARVFADAGFRDMTWAFPVIPSRIPEAAELGEQVRLGVVAEHPGAVERLEEAGHAFPVWIEVDCGYGRSGVTPDSRRLLELGRAVAGSPRLELAGLLTHSGQAYHARTDAELAEAAEEERSAMVEAAERLRSAGIPVPVLSVGSTPGMAGARSLEGVDEARPGNYALYDYTQAVIGSCGVEDVAVTVLATVVSSRPEVGRSVVDAGALALSKDPGPADAPRDTMGEIFRDYGERELHEEARVVSLSQEHGIVGAPLPYGEKVRILPNHSCLTVACFDEFHVVRGDEVVDRWRIHRGR